jgi:hypothetical protein
MGLIMRSCLGILQNRISNLGICSGPASFDICIALAITHAFTRSQNIDMTFSPVFGHGGWLIMFRGRNHRASQPRIFIVGQISLPLSFWHRVVVL